MGTLYAIVTELELSLDELFAASGPRPARAEANGFHIRRSAERKELRLASGVRWEQLTPVTEPGIDFLEITYPPGSESSERERSMRHQGREYGLILEGTLHVRVGGGTCELAAGDTISFDSSLPHRLWNQGSESARAVWIVLGRSGNGG